MYILRRGATISISRRGPLRSWNIPMIYLLFALLHTKSPFLLFFICSVESAFSVCCKSSSFIRNQLNRFSFVSMVLAQPCASIWGIIANSLSNVLQNQCWHCPKTILQWLQSPTALPPCTLEGTLMQTSPSSARALKLRLIPLFLPRGPTTLGQSSLGGGWRILSRGLNSRARGVYFSGKKTFCAVAWLLIAVP